MAVAVRVHWLWAVPILCPVECGTAYLFVLQRLTKKRFNNTRKVTSVTLEPSKLHHGGRSELYEQLCTAARRTMATEICVSRSPVDLIWTPGDGAG